MPEVLGYDDGVPSWVDLATTDLGAGLRFYTALFGWESQDMGEETGHYTIVSKGGRSVAGLMAAGQPAPPHWTVYVNVGDIDAVSAKVARAGGSVVLGPVEVMTAGRTAVFSDPTGAHIAAWQPGEHLGAQLVNEPGAFVWCDLATSDLAGAKAFYTEVFGWGWAGSDQYAELQVHGRTAGGVMPRPPEMPPELPDQWTVYFGATDVDADTARASGLGATVAVPPTDVATGGRFSVLVDPQGAPFALFRG